MQERQVHLSLTFFALAFLVWADHTLTLIFIVPEFFEAHVLVLVDVNRHTVILAIAILLAANHTYLLATAPP